MRVTTLDICENDWQLRNDLEMGNVNKYLNALFVNSEGYKNIIFMIFMTLS